MVTSQIRFCCATMVTPSLHILKTTIHFLLACIISAMKSVVILCYCSKCVSLLWILVTFKIFRLITGFLYFDYNVPCHDLLSFFFFFFFFFLQHMEIPRLIRAAVAGLRHSHSNARSEPHLQSTPQLTATPGP